MSRQHSKFNTIYAPANVSERLGAPATTVTNVNGTAAPGEGEIAEVSEIIIIQQSTATSSDTDTLKLYAKPDGEIYRINNLGIEDQISFDQSLNTDDVTTFSDVIVTNGGLNAFITTTEQDITNLKSQTQNIELISTLEDDTQITGDLTVSQIVYAQDYVTASDTTPISLNNYITTNTNSVIDLQNKTVNITSTSEIPDNTNFKGELCADDMCVDNLFDKTKATVITLDDTVINMQATDVQYNSISIPDTVTDLQTQINNLNTGSGDFLEKVATTDLDMNGFAIIASDIQPKILSIQLVDDGFDGPTLNNGGALVGDAFLTSSYGNSVQVVGINRNGGVRYDSSITGSITQDWTVEFNMLMQYQGSGFNGVGLFLHTIPPLGGYSLNGGGIGDYSLVFETIERKFKLFYGTNLVNGTGDTIPPIVSYQPHNVKISLSGGGTLFKVLYDDILVSSTTVQARQPNRYYAVAGITNSSNSINIQDLKIDIIQPSSIRVGDLVTDTITPAVTDVSDLGNATEKYRDVYLSGTVDADAVVLPGGDVQTQINNLGTTGSNYMLKIADSNLDMTGFNIVGNSTLTTTNVFPLTTNTGNIGSLSNRYKNIYLTESVDCSTINCAGNILGGKLIPITTGLDIGDIGNKYRNAYLTETVNCSQIALPAGDVQGQLGTKMDKIATSALDMNSFNISNAVVTNTSILQANSVQATTVSATAGISGQTIQTTSGDLSISQTGIIKPQATDVVDIGTASLKFRDSYQSGTATANAVLLPLGDVQTQINNLSSGTTANIGLLETKIQNITAVPNETTVVGVLKNDTISPVVGSASINLTGTDVIINTHSINDLASTSVSLETKTQNITATPSETDVVGNITTDSLTTGVINGIGGGGGNPLIQDDFSTAPIKYGGVLLTNGVPGFPFHDVPGARIQLTTDTGAQQFNDLSYNDPTILAAIKSSTVWYNKWTLNITDTSGTDGQGVMCFYSPYEPSPTTLLFSANQAYAFVFRTQIGNIDVWFNGVRIQIFSGVFPSLNQNQEYLIETRMEFVGTTSTILTFLIDNVQVASFSDVYRVSALANMTHVGIGAYGGGGTNFTSNYFANNIEIDTIPSQVGPSEILMNGDVTITNGELTTAVINGVETFSGIPLIKDGFSDDTLAQGGVLISDGVNGIPLHDVQNSRIQLTLDNGVTQTGYLSYSDPVILSAIRASAAVSKEWYSKWTLKITDTGGAAGRGALFFYSPYQPSNTTPILSNNLAYGVMFRTQEGNIQLYFNGIVIAALNSVFPPMSLFKDYVIETRMKFNGTSNTEFTFLIDGQFVGSFIDIYRTNELANMTHVGIAGWSGGGGTTSNYYAYDIEIDTIPSTQFSKQTRLTSNVEISESLTVVKSVQMNDLAVYGLINGITPVGGIFSQIDTTSFSAQVDNETRSMIGTGVGSLSVPANAFKVGDSFHLKCGGQKLNGTGGTLRIMLKTNGATIVDSGVIEVTSVSGAPWELEVDFTIRAIGGPLAAKIYTNGQFTYTDGGRYDGYGFNSANVTTFDTTTTNTLTLDMMQSDAGDLVSMSSFVLQKVF